jgi:hypothetical protein
MKSYDSRTYSINDFVEWDASGQLELNPRFQRRPVWTDKAKSFLIDTILRGKPIPKVFIRQKINVSTRTSVREVVDGQQRLRAILSYVKDGFVVSPRQNPEYGGVFFSSFTDEMQAQILAYEISVDLLINLSDPEILDIFSRLNSYAVVLNEQEKINADHFGPFKVLADRIGHKYYDYWTRQGILTTKSVMRMQEVSMVADLIIAMLEGIKSKKLIKKYYDQYETTFNYSVETLERNFDSVIAKISELYPEGLSDSELHRPHIFYTFFTAVAHFLNPLPNLAPTTIRLTGQRIEIARNNLARLEELFTEQDINNLARDEQQFIQDSRRATTDEVVRTRRTAYLVALISR